MTRLFLSCLFLTMCFVVSGADNPKPLVLGPEWTKVTRTNVVGQKSAGYSRPLVGKSGRAENGDSTAHGVRLECGASVGIVEQDDKSNVSIRLSTQKDTMDTQMAFGVEWDKKGVPMNHGVSFGGISYKDLDGNGTIDCWIDCRGGPRNSVIIVEDRLIKVNDSKNPFINFPGLVQVARGQDPDVYYHFVKGKWAIKPD